MAGDLIFIIKDGMKDREKRLGSVFIRKKKETCFITREIDVWSVLFLNLFLVGLFFSFKEKYPSFEVDKVSFLNNCLCFVKNRFKGGIFACKEEETKQKQQSATAFLTQEEEEESTWHQILFQRRIIILDEFRRL